MNDFTHMIIKHLPVTSYYHTVVCGDCDVEFERNNDIKTNFNQDPVLFPFICPRCKKVTYLTEEEKPQIKYKVLTD